MIKTMRSSISRVYSEVNRSKSEEYSNYKDLDIQYQLCDDYSLIKRIGRGKYSEVFLGIQDSTDRNIVIKVLKPVAEMKLQRELKILSNLQGRNNTIKLLNVVKDELSGTPSFIFEHVENQNYKELYLTFIKIDIKYYISQLLKALDYCHSMGIMHRDVKPQNIVIDHNKKILRLIDWGLAEFYHPGEKYNVRVASRYYKGPELLVNFQMYDYSLDIWATGCTLAGMIFRMDTLFQGKDNFDQLVKIVRTLGSDSFEEYMKKYHIEFDYKKAKLNKRYPRKDWSNYTNDDNNHLICSRSLDLIDKMLRFDHMTRITAKEALNHPFFL